MHADFLRTYAWDQTSHEISLSGKTTVNNYHYYYYSTVGPFVRDYLGEPVPEERFTHSHLS